MALLLGIDLETTGLNPEIDLITEVGMCLWDTTTNKPLSMVSELIFIDSDIPKEITDLTGINQGMLPSALYNLNSFIERHTQYFEADYLVAHNAEFEKSFLAKTTDLDHKAMLNLPWIDTKTDLPYKAGKGKGTLNDIAMCHGVFNIMPHRALSDVLTMMQVLAQYNFETVEQYAQSPTVNLITMFGYDPTGKRQSDIKSLGFYWSPSGKYWYKPVKEFKADAEREAANLLNFDINIERGL